MTLALDVASLDPHREMQPRGEAPLIPSKASVKGQIHPFPYATLVRRLIEKDQVGAARRLVQMALSQGSTDPKLAHWQMLLAPPVVRKSDVRDVDRDLDYQWIDEQSKAYSGQWVALLLGELIAHAPTLKELLAILDVSPPAARPLALRID